MSRSDMPHLYLGAVITYRHPKHGEVRGVVIRVPEQRGTWQVLADVELHTGPKRRETIKLPLDPLQFRSWDWPAS